MGFRKSHTFCACASKTLYLLFILPPILLPILELLMKTASRRETPNGKISWKETNYLILIAQLETTIPQTKQNTFLITAQIKNFTCCVIEPQDCSCCNLSFQSLLHSKFQVFQTKLMTRKLRSESVLHRALSLILSCHGYQATQRDMINFVLWSSLIRHKQRTFI